MHWLSTVLIHYWVRAHWLCVCILLSRHYAAQRNSYGVTQSQIWLVPRISHKHVVYYWVRTHWLCVCILLVRHYAVQRNSYGVTHSKIWLVPRISHKHVVYYWLENVHIRDRWLTIAWVRTKAVYTKSCRLGGLQGTMLIHHWVLCTWLIHNYCMAKDFTNYVCIGKHTMYYRLGLLQCIAG